MDPVYENLEIADLIARHFKGQLDEHGKAALEAWINASRDNQRLWEQLTNDVILRRQIEAMPGTGATGTAWDHLQPQLAREHPRPHIGLRIFMYAAAISGMLLGVALLTYLLLHRPGTSVPAVVATVEEPAVKPIIPGSSKARLILGNGRIVALSDSLEQAFTETDGTLVKSSSSVLTYTGAAATGAPVFNTLEIPRGGEFRVVLPDSSVVWMNAASSLRFPTRFTDSTRTVYLSGEAYFEIARNKRKPFIVSINKISITVTGTKFNVKAYPDEPYINTTLLEGGVALRAADKPAAGPVMLKPGFQGIWEHGEISVKEAYIEEALAWKNGLFVFRSEPIGSIMRKLGRWYDVEIKLSDPAVSAMRFTGTIRKYESIRKVLNMLALTQKIKFRIDDKSITVLKANNQ